MQLNLFDYKELTQTAGGKSQHNDDKMSVVFVEGIKCGKHASKLGTNLVQTSKLGTNINLKLLSKFHVPTPNCSGVMSKSLKFRTR